MDMRGIVFLVLVSAMLISGCVDLSKVDTTPINGSVYPSECSGPVCGTDGVNYPSDCAAIDAGAQAAYSGDCLPRCDDSDGGNEPGTYGTVSTDYVNASDSCEDAITLIEFFCINGTLANSTHICTNSTCELGRCLPIEEADSQNETNQTDGMENESVPEIPEGPGPVILEGCYGPTEPNVSAVETVTFNGTEYTDMCADYKVVKDYYCLNDELVSINNECDPGYSCDRGACRPVPVSCKDTDEGNDTVNRGTVTISKGIYSGFSETDSCIDDGIILEYMCLENGSAISQEILCGNGLRCFSGRCVRSDCDDNDGGYNIYEKGMAEIGSEQYRDECVTDTKLREYYCYGNGVDSIMVECPDEYICDIGRCTQE